MAERTTELAIPPGDSDGPIPGPNPLVIAARRWPLAVLGLLVGGSVAVYIHLSTAPTYQASAQVLVLKKRTDIVQGGDVRVGVLEDYVATQVTLIKSERSRRAAVNEARGMKLTRPLPDDDFAAAQVIGGGLGILRDKDSTSAQQVGSGVLLLTYRGADPSDCRKILDAVIKAYEKELFSLYDKATKDRIATLEKTIEAVQKQRKQFAEMKLEKLRLLRDITAEDVPNVRARVSGTRDKTYTLKLEVIDLTEQLALIDKVGTSRKDRATVLAQLTTQTRAALAAVDQSGTAEANLRTLEARRTELNQELGKDHPQMKAIESQISFFKSELKRQKPDTDLDGLDELAALGKRLEQKLQTTKRQLKQFEESLESDEQKLKQTGTLQDEIEILSGQIQQSDRDVARYDSELLTTRATDGSGGFTAQTITPPADGSKIGPILTNALLAGLAIGLILGGGAILIAELADQSFRSPADLRRRLGLPVVGYVNQMKLGAAPDPGALATLDKTLVTALRSKSSEAESYRGVRAQLMFGIQGRGHQVIQVTSPSPGDGKSTLAANLAIAIAQTGKRVVLLDADLRKPRVHKLFGLPGGENGISRVATGESSLPSAAIDSGIPNLDLILAGPRPKNPAEVLLSPVFIAALADLKRRYDFVIVDTPPMLAVSDPAAVASHVDAVILVLRMTKKARPLAKRAKEQLDALGANILGVVVNGWSGGKGGYGEYNYGYGYRYADYEYAEAYDDDVPETK